MKLSAIMIIRDEEKYILGCLESIKDIVDEICIVDTGSVDKTLDIVNDFALKNKDKFEILIKHSPWQDNFSLHRNESIAMASGDWLMWVDGDERLTDNKEKLRGIMEETDKDAIEIVIHSEHRNSDGKTHGTTITTRAVRHCERTNIHFVDRVHNQVRVENSKGTYRSDVVFLHLGHNQTDEESLKKWERSSRLLKLQIEECKENGDDLKLARSYRYLASHMRIKTKEFPMEDIDEILKIAGAAYQLTDLTKSERWRSHLQSTEVIAHCYLRKCEYRKSLMFCLHALRHKPDYMDVLLYMGFAQMGLGDYTGSIETFNKYLRMLGTRNPAYDYDSILMSMDNHPQIAESGIDEATARMNEKDSDHYDVMFAKGYDTRRYAELYNSVKDLLLPTDIVFDVGCGNGDFAEMISKDHAYYGCDFSKIGIQLSQQKANGYKDNIFIGNAYDPSIYEKAEPANVVIMLEILEHLYDLSAIVNIPSGKRVILSVPNYPDPAHVRTYFSPEYIEERFERFLDIKSIKTIDRDRGMKIFLCDAVRI